MKTFLFIALAFLPLLAFSWPNAYCNIQVRFVQKDCNDVLEYLVSNIQNYTYAPVREFNYTLISKSESDISYIHTTPVHMYVDDGKIHLEQSGSDCVADMASKSRPTSVKDFSTNFCNNYNLLRPGNYDKPPHQYKVTDKSVGAGSDPSQCDEY